MLPFGIYQGKQFILTESVLVSVKTRHHRGERSLVKRSGDQLPEIISPGQVIRYEEKLIYKPESKSKPSLIFLKVKSKARKYEFYLRAVTKFSWFIYF